MIAFPAGAKVWIAGGATDMRFGMNSLALKVQQGLGRDPNDGDQSRTALVAVDDIDLKPFACAEQGHHAIDRAAARDHPMAPAGCSTTNIGSEAKSVWVFARKSAFWSELRHRQSKGG